MPRDLLGSLLTEVSRGGFGLHCATSPSRAQAIASDRRPGPACRGSPGPHAPSPRLLTWVGTSRGYSTAARALVGKSYAPSAPRAGQGTPDAEGRRGAPPCCRLACLLALFGLGDLLATTCRHTEFVCMQSRVSLIWPRGRPPDLWSLSRARAQLVRFLRVQETPPFVHAHTRNHGHRCA